MREWGPGSCGVFSDRSQSNVIAVVLLAGLVAVGAIAVVLAGSVAIEESQRESSLTVAENSFNSLDSTIRSVSQNDTGERGMTLPEDGDVHLSASSPSTPTEAGKVSITVDPASGTATTEEIWLGTVRYEQDGQTVAYQGGGVWRQTGGGSNAVSPPPISYRVEDDDGTLTFPIVSVEGEPSGSNFEVDSVDSADLLRRMGVENPVEPGTEVTIEIRSEFYDGWATELEAEVGSNAVQVSEADKRVTVTFRTPAPSSAPSAVLINNPDNKITISNFGVTDSFDSSSGPYGSYPEESAGDVLTKGAVAASNKMSIHGDLITERGIGQNSGVKTLANKIEVHERTIFGDDPDIGPDEYLVIAGNHQQFHGLFSTKDNLKITKPTVFGDDVLVDGDLYVTANQNNRPEFENEGDIVVTGTIEGISAAEISGNVLVDGDADGIGTKNLDLDGDLVANGDVELSSDAEIYGDVIVPTGATVDGQSQATVHGDIRRDSNEVSDRLGEAPEPIEPEVPERESSVDEINERSSLESDNDNDEESVIQNDRLDFSQPDHTLGPGEYYLERLNVPKGETLELDTTSGDVVIYVADNPANTAVRVAGVIEVLGEDPANRVRMYVDDSDGGDPELEMEITDAGSGSVSVPDDRTPNMWVYLKPTTDVDLNGDVTFQGVLYGAPDGSSDGAEISVSNHAEVFGTLIGDVQQLPNHAQVHYDQALSDEDAFDGSAGESAIRYVHLPQESAEVDD